MLPSYFVLSCFIQLCYVVDSLPQDSDKHSTSGHFVYNKLKEAYMFVFQKEESKTTKEDDYVYSTPALFDNFMNIVQGNFVKNKTRWEYLQDKTMPEESEESDSKEEQVTADPVLMRINPSLAMKAKEDREKIVREQQIIEQQAASRMKWYKDHPTRRNMYATRAWRKFSKESEEEENSEEPGILGKIGNKIMGGLFNVFQNTLVKAATEDKTIGETFKEDLGRTAKKAGEHLKTGFGTIKDKAVEGISKVAGVVGRKLGEFFANYQHGRHLPGKKE